MNEQKQIRTTTATSVMLCFVAAGLILGAALEGANLDAIATPFFWLGNALRALAGFGWWGNLLVWLMVLGGSLAPVAYAIGNRYKVELKKTNVLEAANSAIVHAEVPTHNGADWLLVLLSAQTFAFFFFAINPSYIPQPQGLPMQGAYIAVTLWAMVATLGCYALLRFALRMQNLPVGGAANLLPKLLKSSAYLLFLLSAASASQAFCATLAAMQAGNTGGTALEGSIMVLLIVSAVRLFATLLSGATLLWGGDVAMALLQAPYAVQTIALCEQRAKSCVWVVRCALLACVGCNVVQLMLFGLLHDVSIAWSIPLLPLLLAGALFLLCHYVAGAHALAEDNESII